jgi:hypothetical protein
VPLVFALTFAKQTAGALVLWLYKPLSVPAPGKYGAVLTLPLLALALWLSLRTEESAPIEGRARATPATRRC